MIQQAFRALLLILAIAVGCDVAWQFMSPFVPTVAVVLGLVVVFAIMLQFWRR